MPSDPLRKRVVRTALALPEARTLALADGGTMIVHGFVTRETKDVVLRAEELVDLSTPAFMVHARQCAMSRYQFLGGQSPPARE